MTRNAHCTHSVYLRQNNNGLHCLPREVPSTAPKNKLKLKNHTMAADLALTVVTLRHSAREHTAIIGWTSS